jgi:CheY-like chemotaxis protein
MQGANVPSSLAIWWIWRSTNQQRIAGNRMAAKILIVEDNPDSREMLGCWLRLNDFSVVYAEDGLQALAVIETERPALIITDLAMPNLNGIELIKRLRKQPETRDLPILVMTACRADMIANALQEGANAAAGKPLEMERLIELVEQLT